MEETKKTNVLNHSGSIRTVLKRKKNMANATQNSSVKALSPSADRQLPSAWTSPSSPTDGKHESLESYTEPSVRTKRSSFLEDHDPPVDAAIGESSEALAFYTGGRTFIWTDLYAHGREHRLNFARAFPTCHDILAPTSDFPIPAGSSGTRRHPFYAHHGAIEIAIGFSTGDVIVYDPSKNTFDRFNRQGSMHASPVTCIRWMTSNCFSKWVNTDGELKVVMNDVRLPRVLICSHEDGSVLFLSRAATDAPTMINLKPISQTDL